MAKGKTRSPREGLSASATHLLHRALQLALDYHAEAAGPSAVTQRQFTVLAAAGAADGQTQNDLVRATGIDRSTLADLVARMAAKGLLEREPSATDARANTVRLSKAGRDALAQSATPAAAADARLLAFLSPKKRESFLKILATLAAAADAPPSGKPNTPKPKAHKAGKKKKKKVKKAKAAKQAAGIGG
ncbi:MAG: winged helix-turn-helix transcriptional regulator [Caulobacteraceae bacterium]|nr:winged helix-turn-helix transcriptional regulator [Caulobacteraceae bacterium]